MKAKFLRAVPILSLLVCLICLWQVAALKKQVTQLQTNLSSHTAEQIRAATTALAQATDDFAAKRMNRNIQRALTGQSVENL